jgi:phosphatidylinositol glycan class P protein
LESKLLQSFASEVSIDWIAMVVSHRYWAMAIPSYLMVAIFFICTFYTSLNYIATPPPHSLNTLFDEHTRQPMKVLCTSGSLGKEDQPIDSLSDIPITTVNALLFDHKLG